MNSLLLTVVLVVHVLVAITIIGLVLLQHGKGADVGASFGSGSSGSLFGATGSANFLSRTTSFLAAVFFLTSLGLAYLASHQPRESSGVMDAVKEAPATKAPAAGQSEIPKPSAGEGGQSGGDAASSKANEVPK